MQTARRRARRAQLSDPHRPRPAGRRGSAAGAARCRVRARSIVTKPIVAAHLARAAAREPRGGGHRQRDSCVPDGEAHKNLATLQRRAHAAARAARRALDDAGRARRRRRRRHRGLRRRDLPARHAVRAGADHAARAGRFVGRRQDRRQPSARQEHDRRVPSAARRADRHAIACRRSPSASSRAGLAEVIKYGAIRDARVLRVARSERRAPARARCRRAHRMRSPRAAGSRRDIVAADEREAGERALLNFGHTFGHAIESGDGLRRMAARRGGRGGHGAGGRAVASASAADATPTSQRLTRDRSSAAPAGDCAAARASSAGSS